MFSGKYGLFATTITIAATLFAVFSVLLMKAVGKVSQWTFLADDSPPFMVTAGARALAIALIALSFIFIDKSNYGWFGGAAVIFAFLMIIFIARFDRIRRAHICKVPLLEDGHQKRGWLGSLKWQVVVIGSEIDMKPQAATHYQKFGAGSLCKFLSGYGRNEVNNPEAIWTKQTLARISSHMTILLIGILLCGVMALYLAASAVEVHQRVAPTGATPTQTQ
ncbi:hypothetical protein HAP47_0022865 [Bradyrhizobium sp. 41S5]|uniref:hypothetical protein n=1 Tax=Bradyrhizobium sp. 41S5 TaxID=1404443 RepID=UPI00156B7AAE|nr:hypothetical protein [Bradyrhizobium sp. 41S5]UFX42106.1 hypothetical protein HAP47_0022865 [Bradyrhizobium sp. 41S5]